MRMSPALTMFQQEQSTKGATVIASFCVVVGIEEEALALEATSCSIDLHIN